MGLHNRIEALRTWSTYGPGQVVRQSTDLLFVPFSRMVFGFGFEEKDNAPWCGKGENVHSAVA